MPRRDQEHPWQCVLVRSRQRTYCDRSSETSKKVASPAILDAAFFSEAIGANSRTITAARACTCVSGSCISSGSASADISSKILSIPSLVKGTFARRDQENDIEDLVFWRSGCVKDRREWNVNQLDSPRHLKERVAGFEARLKKRNDVEVLVEGMFQVRHGWLHASDLEHSSTHSIIILKRRRHDNSSEGLHIHLVRTYTSDPLKLAVSFKTFPHRSQDKPTRVGGRFRFES